MNASGGTDRLFRHDWQIATNAVRATFARWPDRVIAAIVLLAALGGVRAAIAERAWMVAACAAVAVGLMIGVAAARLTMARLAFHAFDGVLAADALQPCTRRRYAIACHGIGIVLVGGIALIVRPSLLFVAIAAYLAGVVMRGLTDGVAVRLRMVASPRPGWSLGAWLRRSVAGGAAAVVLLLSALQVRSSGETAVIAFSGVASVALAAALTRVDARVVRFMTITGHGTRRIVQHLSRALAAFVALAVPGSGVILGAASAAIVAAACGVMALLLVLRVLAYRLHGKRFADLLVLLLAALLMLVGYAMPLAVPVVGVALVWHFQHRAAAKTWLLA